MGLGSLSVGSSMLTMPGKWGCRPAAQPSLMAPRARMADRAKNRGRGGAGRTKLGKSVHRGHSNTANGADGRHPSPLHSTSLLHHLPDSRSRQSPCWSRCCTIGRMMGSSSSPNTVNIVQRERKAMHARKKQEGRPTHLWKACPTPLRCTCADSTAPPPRRHRPPPCHRRPPQPLAAQRSRHAWHSCTHSASMSDGHAG